MNLKEYRNYFLENVREDSKRGLLINLTLILLLSLSFVYLFFGIYLPNTTIHQESITVPNLEGLSIEEIREMLPKRDLRFEVTDSSFSNFHEPNVVIAQVPLPNARVKVNRKIYLKINSKKIPKIKIPNIIDSPLPNAQERLRNYGLVVGKKEYLPHRINNKVLGIVLGEDTISRTDLEKGIHIPKDQPLHLLVGDGIGKVDLKTPYLIGMPLDEAEIYILGLNLRVGNLHWVTSSHPYGTVLNQQPKYKSSIRLKESIDLWVAAESKEHLE